LYAHDAGGVCQRIAINEGRAVHFRAFVIDAAVDKKVTGRDIEDAGIDRQLLDTCALQGQLYIADVVKEHGLAARDERLGVRQTHAWHDGGDDFGGRGIHVDCRIGGQIRHELSQPGDHLGREAWHVEERLDTGHLQWRDAGVVVIVVDAGFIGEAGAAGRAADGSGGTASGGGLALETRGGMIEALAELHGGALRQLAAEAELDEQALEGGDLFNVQLQNAWDWA
jgi:hypothetical protein